MTTEHPHRK